MRAPDLVMDLAGLGSDRLSAWEALCVATGAGYFTGPVWASSWYDSFGAGAPTEVGLWQGGGGLEAVAALVRSGEPLLPGSMGRRLRVDRWENLGAGIGGADHTGFPCTDDRRRDVLDWVLAHRGPLRLSNLDGGWTSQLAAAGVPAGIRTRTYSVPLVPGERTGSKKLWKHIARSRRQLVERGVDFDVVVGRAIDRALLVQLFSLHGIRSERVGRTTTFTADRLALHSRLAERSTSVHSSFLVRARLDGHLIGALYGFADPATVHYYQSGWDPAFERSSLGSVLIGEAVDLAAERGAARFDFLRGDEAYKLRFGAGPVEDVSALVPRGTSGHLLAARDRAAATISARRARNAEGSAPESGAQGRGI